MDLKQVIKKLDFEEIRMELEGKKVSELAALIADWKETLDLADKVKKEMQKAYDFVTISIVPDRMDDEGIETLKVAGVGRLQASSDIRCSVPAVNREALEYWLRENGHGELVKSSVNSSSLKAFVKEQMREDGNYPKELLKIEPFSRATVVKA